MNTILSIANFLEAMKNSNLQEIEQFFSVKHGPSIGDMYEGLTKDIIEKCIFSGMDLHVVKGFIINQCGAMSDEIDCMLVVGNGKQMPHTDRYIYDIEQVVMVIQVKKHLFSNELSDGYENLLSVLDVQSDSLKNCTNNKSNNNELGNEKHTTNVGPIKKSLRYDTLDQAFRNLRNKPLAPDINTMTSEDQMIYHTLVSDVWSPLRVIFGYSGFKDEKSLRDKFVDFLEKGISNTNASHRQFGPSYLPDLVIVENASLVKTNSFPYAITSDEFDGFCWIGSYRRSPLLILIELLWTRLRFFYDIPELPFGEDLQLESIAPLLVAAYADNSWKYTVIPLSLVNPSYIEMDEDWKPTEISKTEFIMLNILSKEGEIEVAWFLGKLATEGENADDVLKHLVNEHLVFVENEKIRFLTHECKTVIMPDGKCFAADDTDGRLSRWIGNWLKRHKLEGDGIEEL